MGKFEVQNYGFNVILKEYARFPRLFPLPCHIEHGWTTLEEALVSDLKTTKPLMMVFSKRRLEAWKRSSTIPAVIMGAPFIHYKNLRNITKNKDAKGTVVFPSHSTFDLKAQFDIHKFCKQLQELPEEFKPITVCLFWIDYIDAKADIYRKAGFSVVTTGPKFGNSLSFPKNFYNILAQHAYSTSNDVGSYTFYSVEFGVPFFLTGESSIVLNKGQRDVNIGAIGRIEDTKFGLDTHRLFSTGPVTTTSPEQKKFVEAEMGVNECLSREEMHDLLWKYWNKKEVIPHIIDSSLKSALLNGPWGKGVISLRNKLGQKGSS